MPVGVDGGVGEDNLGDVLAAGATYVVVGRRLFPVTTTSTKEEQV
jgi:pentose-5-phosphate-3-epimerase